MKKEVTTIKEAKRLSILKWKLIVNEIKEMIAKDESLDENSEVWVSSYIYNEELSDLHSHCGLCQYTIDKECRVKGGKRGEMLMDYCAEFCPLPALDNGLTCFSTESIFFNADSLAGAQKMLETLEQIKTEEDV